MDYSIFIRNCLIIFQSGCSGTFSLAVFERVSCSLFSLTLAIKWTCEDIGERDTLTHMNAIHRSQRATLVLFLLGSCWFSTGLGWQAMEPMEPTRPWLLNIELQTMPSCLAFYGSAGHQTHALVLVYQALYHRAISCHCSSN